VRGYTLSEQGTIKATKPVSFLACGLRPRIQVPPATAETPHPPTASGGGPLPLPLEEGIGVRGSNV